MRGAAAVFIAIALLVAAGLAAWRLTLPPRPTAPAATVYAPVGFEGLRGWAEDPLDGAVEAFANSCRRFTRWSDDEALGPPTLGLRAADWKPACQALAELSPEVDAAARRAFFETWFRPLEVREGDRATGLFTGYYEPLLHGTLAANDAYGVPLYPLPLDLVRVELGRFDPELKGKRVAGRVVKGELEPYPDRAEIEDKGLAGAPPLVWVDDAVDAFFLQIQGSGRVRLPDGREVRLGYAGQNGRPYRAIGRDLIAMGALTRENVSMQSIRAWLDANPDRADEVMRANPSYVFFELQEGPGPLGALGVPLTAGRSLAVDRRAMPLGAPVWLEASRPDADARKPDVALHRLLVAQDTGGAIRGAVRGDVFWGHGDEAYEIAGRMKHPGRWYLLLPKGAVARLTAR